MFSMSIVSIHVVTNVVTTCILTIIYIHAEHCSVLTSMSNWLTVTSNWHSNSYSNINSSNWHYKNNDAFVLNKITGTNSNYLTTHSLAANMTAT